MNKYRFMCVSLIVILVCIFSMKAVSDESDVEKQKALQKEIEHSLIAPCCWNMTVDQHDSQAARQVRAKVTELIQQGKNKEEILAYFVAQPQYGERILSEPSQKSLLGKLAYWLIPIAIFLGLIFVVVAINRLSQKPSSKPSKPSQTVEEKTPQPSSYDEKVESELKQLD